MNSRPVIVAISFALSLAWSCQSARSSPSQLKPVLQAIDPSLAKTDTYKKPGTTNPNPGGRINGKPISQQTRGSGQAAPTQDTDGQGSGGGTARGGYDGQGAAPDGGYSSQGAYPPQDGGYSSQGAYPPQDGGYSSQGAYPPQDGGYSSQGAYPPQDGGYSSQGAYPPQDGGYSSQGAYPPQGGGYSSQGAYPPQGGGYCQGSYRQGNSFPQAPAATSTFPSESLIPDFGKPLPQAPQQPGQADAQPNYGQGFNTYRAPDSTAAPTPLTNYAAQGQSSAVESRLARLEQIAFGSTYPEHELNDRVDHLETEVFGSAGRGDMSSRLARLETKLGGQGAFGQTGQAPVSPPVVATAYAPDRPVQMPTSYAGAQAPDAVPPPAYSSAYPSGRTNQPAPPVVATAAPPAWQRRQSRQPTAPLSQDNVAAPAQDTASAGTAASFTAGSKSNNRGTGNWDSQAVINSIPLDSKAGDYFPQIRRGPNGTVARWTSFPVRIHLPQGSPQSWQASLESGVRHWGQYLPLSVAAASESANIEVVWINHLPPDALGITRVQVQRGNMQCVVYLLRPTYYLPEVPERALSGVFLHEMGHALGIFGHSDFGDDIMVPVELSMAGRKRGVSSKYKFGNITPRDVNTLKHIYETPSVPADFSSPTPTDWTIKAAHR